MTELAGCSMHQWMPLLTQRATNKQVRAVTKFARRTDGASKLPNGLDSDRWLVPLFIQTYVLHSGAKNHIPPGFTRYTISKANKYP